MCGSMEEYMWMEVGLILSGIEEGIDYTYEEQKKLMEELNLTPGEPIDEDLVIETFKTLFPDNFG